MQIFRGKGKIYDCHENFLDNVTYEIHLQTPTESTGAEWWGEITPDNGIMPVGKYIIELDDGRRGRCLTSMKTNSSFGLVVDTYHLEGTGPLQRKKEPNHDISH